MADLIVKDIVITSEEIKKAAEKYATKICVEEKHLGLYKSVIYDYYKQCIFDLVISKIRNK